MGVGVCVSVRVQLRVSENADECAYDECGWSNLRPLMLAERADDGRIKANDLRHPTPRDDAAMVQQDFRICTRTVPFWYRNRCRHCRHLYIVRSKIVSTFHHQILLFFAL